MWVKFLRPWGRHTTDDVVSVRPALGWYLVRREIAERVGKGGPVEFGVRRPPENAAFRTRAA